MRLSPRASHLTDRGRPRTNGRGYWTSSSAPLRRRRLLMTRLFALIYISTRIHDRARAYAHGTHTCTHALQPYVQAHLNTSSKNKHVHIKINLEEMQTHARTHTFAHLIAQEHLCDARHFRRRAAPPRPAREESCGAFASCEGDAEGRRGSSASPPNVLRLPSGNGE